MNKSSKSGNAARVMEVMNKYRVQFKVLQSGTRYPIHIRTNEMDMWPGTGSYEKKGLVTKGGINQLLSVIDRTYGTNAPQHISVRGEVGRVHRTEQIKERDLVKRVLELESSHYELIRRLEQLSTTIDYLSKKFLGGEHGIT